MALVNCTINSTSFSVAKDQALTSLVSDKVLVITPNSGHVCAATSFIVDGALPSGVSSINLSDSDVAFSNNNTVLVTIDLDDSFVPSADTVITIDIDGAAIPPDNLIPKITVNGTINFDGTNVSEADYTGTSYSKVSSVGNESQLIISQNVTASSGKFFAQDGISYTVPSYGGPAGSYRVDITNQVYTSGNLTSATINVFYDFGDVGAGSTATGHVINLVATATAISVKAKLITSVSTDLTSFQGGSIRDLLVYSTTTDCNYVITITRTSDSHTYDFTTDTFTSASTTDTGSIGSSVLTKTITYPVNSSGDTYNISVTGDGTTTFTTQGSNSDNTPFTLSLSQVSPISLTIDAETTSTDLSFAYTNTGPHALNANADYSNPNTGNSDLVKNISIVASAPSGRNLFLRDTTPDFATDFDNNDAASNGGLDFEIDKFSLAGNGTTSITLGAYLNIYATGASSVVSSFLADNIINKPPVTSASSFTASASGDTTHGLTASDPNNDTLSYIVVTAPSKGTLSISSSGVATYTRNFGVTGSDLFRFKVNDGFEDSNDSQVSVTLGSSGVFSYNTTYYYRDSSHATNSTTEYPLATVFSGSLTATNLVAGSSSNVTLKVDNWSLDATHAGIPTYMNAVQDYDEVFYRLKGSNGSVINHGQIPINYSACTFNNSARTGSVETTTLTTTTNNLAAEDHTLEIVIVYKNNANI